LSVRWLADENLNNDIVRAPLRRRSELDIVRAQDVGLSGIEDPIILAWAASEGRITLTHDVSTMTAHAYARVLAGEPMPSVFEVAGNVPTAAFVEDILLLSDCSFDSESEGQVRCLPLR
jgi:predicted nuclease of predicted toxin-antitoxin system